MRDCFSNLREYAGQAEKYYLVKDKDSIVTIDTLPKYDISRACNILMSKDSDGSIGFKHDHLFHKDVDNGSLAIPTVVVNANDAATNVDGIDFQSNAVNIPNQYLGNSVNRLDVYHEQGGEISIGGANTKITDSSGPANELNIYSIGGGTKFPEWDLFFEIDNYLSNADLPCRKNDSELTSDRACENCEKRAYNYWAWEYDRMQNCSNHMYSLCSDYPEDGSDIYKMIYIDFAYSAGEEAVHFGGTGIYINYSTTFDLSSDEECVDIVSDYPNYGELELFWASSALFTEGTNYRIDLVDNRIFYWSPNDNVAPPTSPPKNSGSWSFSCEGGGAGGGAYGCSDPGPYGLGQGITIPWNDGLDGNPHDVYCWDREKLNETESYDECKQSCEEGTSSPITRHWRYTSRNMGCENPSTVRVDAAYECGCGGEFITVDANEDMSCGWKALMNDPS